MQLYFQVSSRVVLRVDHIPILRSALRRRSEPGLAVNISGVNIVSNGISWLQCLLKEKQIRFTLLKRQNDFLHCIVYFEVGYIIVYSIIAMFPLYCA